MAEIKSYADIIRSANSGETVRDAIISCIKEINADAAVKAKNLLITTTDNKTYRAGTGYAFKNVTVNIDGSGQSDPNKTYNLSELTITSADAGELHTYPDPPDDNLVYSKVTVDIDWNDFGGNLKLGDVATMSAVEGPDDSGLKYWDANLAGYDYVKRIYIDPNSGIKLPDYPGTGGTTGPFTVTFRGFNNEPLATVSNILYGHDAHEYIVAGSGADKIAAVEASPNFRSWSPDVNHVYSNFTATPSSVTAGVGGSLSDYTWEQIMGIQDQIKVGATAVLVSAEVSMPSITITSKAKINSEGNKATLHLNAHTYPAGFFTIPVMCVAKGEGGTHCTWLATTKFPRRMNEFVTEAGGSMDPQASVINATQYGCEDMESSVQYTFLSKYVAQMFDESIRSNLMVDNTKKQYSITSYDLNLNQIKQEPAVNSVYFVKKTSKDKIWLPSLSELSSLCKTAAANEYTSYNQSNIRAKGYISPDDGCLFKLDEGGRDYGAVWHPSAFDAGQSFQIPTRSSWLGTTRGNVLIGVTSRVIVAEVKCASYVAGDADSCTVIGSDYNSDINTFYIGFNT